MNNGSPFWVVGFWADGFWDAVFWGPNVTPGRAVSLKTVDCSQVALAARAKD